MFIEFVETVPRVYLITLCDLQRNLREYKHIKNKKSVFLYSSTIKVCDIFADIPFTERRNYMEINKIFGNINLSKVNKSNSAKKSGKIKGDQISLSNEVKKLAEQQKYIDIVKEAPDIRWDVVDKVKEKLDSDNYLDEIDMNLLAEKILNQNK